MCELPPFACAQDTLAYMQSPTLFFSRGGFFNGLLILIVCGVGGKPLENNHTLQSDSGYICKDGSYQELIYLE